MTSRNTSSTLQPCTFVAFSLPSEDKCLQPWESRNHTVARNSLKPFSGFLLIRARILTRIMFLAISSWSCLGPDDKTSVGVPVTTVSECEQNPHAGCTKWMRPRGEYFCFQSRTSTCFCFSMGWTCARHLGASKSDLALDGFSFGIWDVRPGACSADMDCRKWGTSHFKRCSFA